MDISVRQMKDSDYEAVHHIDILTQKQYLGDEFDHLSEEEQEKHLFSRKSEFLINVNTGFCFVAEDEGKIIGFLLAHETLPFHGKLYIRYVGLDPKYQGKGLGVLMCNELVKKAYENNIEQITALINLDNPQSLKLCEKVGFIIKDRKEAVLEL